MTTQPLSPLTMLLSRHTRRREFITLLSGAAVAWPLAASAQQPERLRRIGVLMPLGESDPEAGRRIAAFTQALRDLGWSAPQTITFEYRYADGRPERLPALASELVESKVDVIVTQAAQPVEAARSATTTIPIVMASVGDAVGAGYIASLARPGGNITGQTLVATEQSAKRLDLIKQIHPGLARVAVLWNPQSSGHRLQMKEMELAVPILGMELQSIPVRNVEEIEAGMRAAMQAGAQAIVTMEDPLIQASRARIVELAMRQRVPVMGEFRPVAVAGALMSYGASQVEMWRGAASYVDKILKGAKPGELPVQQPTKFELVINLKTASALGITVPATLLVAADEVIE
jgi:putative tryptophan/tyrosine transport system substrate-binding protein